ncbi:hypothetical protein P175DRAFT_0490003 [Aspergillus ochraceoroseus IBT 24754]|uniref:GDP/GTP exchange factor Sec2 N-terminal domain-containing protein n=2 Tax=Aspergillus ochraceoroseus TaxID=138278 RepID=A0A2T5M8R2_9EURO|nr:uncharacterized protein P175DRAFT_0490003 [Aspergillus ochraceoroseus IBT 24754]KKK19138.1 hypothetical protein AOCH_004355 [Aspergillus ochraceoroseus]PTU24917.1 hypothetical protein P175DRAFT_0490003 [Aspergillus ochraceoroseus IBT 24754]
MSTTTTTLVGLIPSMSTATALIPGKTCPTCGQDGFLSQDHSTEPSRRRVKDLEDQVHFLNAQAVQMAEKLAEYEEEVRRLRAQTAYTPRNGSSISSTLSARTNHDVIRPGSQSHSSSPPAQQQGRLSSLASFLPYRRPSTASHQSTQSQQLLLLQQQQQQRTQTQTGPITSSPPQVHAYTQSIGTRSSCEDTLELQNALNREQTLRKAAETQLSQASTELEELTVQLFSQANEMVAQERKARARLEERVAVLEQRDIEKRSRLERLEKAMERVERIRALVG